LEKQPKLILRNKRAILSQTHPIRIEQQQSFQDFPYGVDILVRNVKTLPGQLLCLNPKKSLQWLDDCQEAYEQSSAVRKGYEILEEFSAVHVEKSSSRSFSAVCVLSEPSWSLPSFLKSETVEPVSSKPINTENPPNLLDLEQPRINAYDIGNDGIQDVEGVRLLSVQNIHHTTTQGNELNTSVLADRLAAFYPLGNVYLNHSTQTDLPLFQMPHGAFNYLAFPPVFEILQSQMYLYIEY